MEGSAPTEEAKREATNRASRVAASLAAPTSSPDEVKALEDALFPFLVVSDRNATKIAKLDAALEQDLDPTLSDEVLGTFFSGLHDLTQLDTLHKALNPLRTSSSSERVINLETLIDDAHHRTEVAAVRSSQKGAEEESKIPMPDAARDPRSLTMEELQDAIIELLNMIDNGDSSGDTLAQHNAFAKEVERRQAAEAASNLPPISVGQQSPGRASPSPSLSPLPAAPASPPPTPIIADEPEDGDMGGEQIRSIYCGLDRNNKPPNSIWGNPLQCLRKGYAIGKSHVRA